jgi:N-(2-amino-2-carboxyethyl)-L-glutamate synthase
MSKEARSTSRPTANVAFLSRTRARLRARLGELRRAIRPTPIVKLDLPGADVFVKLESHGVVGSIKDRPAFWILQEALSRGDVGPETTVVESSSGNFAIALAAYCRWLGLPFVPVIDPNIAPFNAAILRSLCSRVEGVHERDDAGGFLKTRLVRVRELCREIGDSFWTNQYGNLDGALGHYHFTAAEIGDQVNELDYVFVGVSSAGTIAGLSMRLKERFPRLAVVAVDSVGSAIFGGPPASRFIPGIGSSIVPELLTRARIDHVVRVPEAEAVSGCRELLARYAIFAGGSTGSVFAAVKQVMAVERGSVRPKVLFLCADRGTAYLDTVYDDQWIKRLRRTS